MSHTGYKDFWNPLEHVRWSKRPPDAPVMIALPEVWQQLADLMGDPDRMHARFLELVASGQITYVVKHGDED